MMAQIMKVMMKTMAFRLLQESLESRKSEARSRLALNMMVPMNVLEGSKDQRATGSESG